MSDAKPGLAARLLDIAEDGTEDDDSRLRKRVGVVAGYILFDIWGETVNLAARMESSGIVDAVQLAPSTAELLRDKSALERRDVDVKGVGRVETFIWH